MKKVLIGLAAGAMALGASVVPASAGYQDFDDDIMTGLEDDGPFGDFIDLVEVSGYDEKFDVPDGEEDYCSNGDAQYTVFAPLDSGFVVSWVEIFETLLGKTWVQILATPGIAKAVVDDHVVNNSITAATLENPTTAVIVARSGYKIAITASGSPRNVPVDTGYSPVNPNVSADGRVILNALQKCNGWIYAIPAPFSTSPKAVTEGTGPQDSPDDGTPGGTNTLPNTL